jgi:Family of unknown function (DUF6580)
VLYATAFRLVDDHYRLVNLAAVGALALFVGARLRSNWLTFVVPLAVLVASDWLLWWQHEYDSIYHPLNSFALNYACYVAYVLLGMTLRQTESPWRIGLAALAGSVLFFLLSNGVAWLIQHPGNETIPLPFRYERSFAGLMTAYANGLPFFRGTLASDLIFTGAVFGAHAVLARTVFPAERVTQPQEVVA